MRRTFEIAILLLVAGGIGLWLVHELDLEMDRPAVASEPVRIQVAPGEALHGILLRLQQEGALRDARLVQWYLRLHGQRPRVQAGTYEIPPHATAHAVLEQFIAGRVVLEQLTVVEGWTVAQLRHALDSQPDLIHQLRGLTDAQLMSALGHDGQAAEGRFFPDSYRFAAGTTDRRILELAYDRMQHELAQAWDTRAPDLPLKDPEQALILASIVEKETGREDEQSDPTVIYGLGARYDGDIHTRDLVTDTPYNTYTRAGLPPTPIALPGAASLQATLHPANIDALYFVATGNGDGSHHFSATLAEHDLAVRSYLHKLGVPVRAAAPAPSQETR